MKKFFVTLFYAVTEAAGGGATETAKTETVQKSKELTSPELDKLKTDYGIAWAEMLKHTDPFSEDTKNARLAVWKIDGEIKNEQARLLKVEADAKLTELRNERLKLNQIQLDAYSALIAVRADKKATPDALAAAELAFNTAKEAVDNELLAKYASSSPAKKSVATTEGSDSGSDSDKAKIIELHLAGKTAKEIEAAGFARSTVWHAIDKHKKANAVPK